MLLTCSAFIWDIPLSTPLISPNLVKFFCSVLLKGNTAAEAKQGRLKLHHPSRWKQPEIALLLGFFGKKDRIHPGCYGNFGQIGRALP